MKKELSKIESEENEHEQGNSVVLPRTLKVEKEKSNQRKTKVRLILLCAR